MPAPESRLSPLTRLKREGRRAALPLAAISFAMNALVLALPIYSVQIFDRVLHSGSLETLAMLTAILVVLLVAMAVFENIRTRMMHRVGEWAEELLLPAAARLAVTGEAAAEHGPIGDVRILRAFLSGAGALALIDLPWLPLFGAAAFLLHPAIGWFTVVVACLLFALTIANEMLTHRRGQAAAQAQVAVMARLGELARKQEAAAGLSMFDPFLRREMAANAEANAEARAVTDMQSGFASVSKMIRMGSQTLVMGAAAVLVLDHALSSGGMLAASILLGRALLPIDAALGGWRQLQAARDAWTRLKAAFQGWAPTAGTTLPVPRGDLSVENAAFALPGTGRKLVEGLTLGLAAGAVLAVVGPSGSGKSTLCRLLVGALKPSAGAVRMDGAAIADWTEEQRRRHIGYLPQDLALFAGAVGDNIARFTHAADLEIVAAAVQANCDDMVRALPGGYGFRLDDGGAPLSGGQRQRLALARALFGAPRLVVLDEPNSNLDSDGDAALVQSVRMLKQAGVTVVIVTHRPALVAEADMIAVMNAGRLAHLGPARDALTRLQAVTDQMARAKAIGEAA